MEVVRAFRTAAAAGGEVDSATCVSSRRRSRRQSPIMSWMTRGTSQVGGWTMDATLTKTMH